jgi:predicted kinase
MRQKNPAKLMFFCGKMAEGKSTLARNLAVQENAVLLVQNDFLNALFPGEITSIPGFGRARFSRQYQGGACMVSRADRAWEC